MLVGALQQPYVFSLVVAIAVSAVLWAWSKFTDKDADRPRKTFLKTLTASLFVGMPLTYFVHSRGGGAEAVAVEPFDAPLGGAAGL